MTDPFLFNDYREFIKTVAAEEVPKWGVWARLAKAAGCQRTYLSQVMREKAHVTADHLIGISEYLQLTPLQTDHLLLLLEYQRAGTEKLRRHLKKQLDVTKKEREHLATRLEKKKIETTELETLYYSAWYWSALHVMTSIPHLRTVRAMSERIQMPESQIESALQKLEKFAIVRRVGQEWHVGAGSLHAPKESMMAGIHHNHWRQRAVLDAMLPQHTDGVHFTSVVSVSQRDLVDIKERVLALIQYTEKTIPNSAEEEMVCFSCDLFRV